MRCPDCEFIDYDILDDDGTMVEAECTNCGCIWEYVKN